MRLDNAFCYKEGGYLTSFITLETGEVYMILESFFEGLPGEPGFRQFPLGDVNPLGGTAKRRLISDPNNAMRMLHGRLIRYLRSLQVNLQLAMGARPGKSPRHNAGVHGGHRYLYLTDISDAYGSVNGGRLAEVLCALDGRLAGEERAVSQFLERYCLSPRGGLAVGFPASPDLFNIYAAVLIDGPLAEYCLANHLTVTRYLDDVTISADHPIGKVKRRKVREILRNAGFSVNHKKSFVLDLRKGTTVVTGIGLNQDGRLFIPRHFLSKVRGLLLLARNNPIAFKQRIAGAMGVFFSARPRRGSFNRTERKILSLYWDFRNRLNRARRR